MTALPFPAFEIASATIAIGTIAAVLAARSGRQALIAAFAGATALLIFLAAYFNFYHDDAYITFRYAKHLADGLGPNWNATGRVEGYTTFLWMALLAGIGKLGFDIVSASRVVAFLAVVGTFLTVFAIWQLWRKDDPESGVSTPVVPAAVLVGLALVPAVPFWGFSGMETPLFMALITVGAYLYLWEARRRSLVPWSALAFVAAALTRPEGLVAIAVTGAFVAAEAFQSTDRGRAFQQAAIWGGAAVFLYGAYFLWRFSYYDSLLPNTYYAKSEPSLRIFSRGAGYLTTIGVHYHFIPLFAGAAALLSRPQLRRDAAYLLALIAAILAGVVFEGGDDFGHGRFVMPILPLLFLAGLAGGAVVLKRAALPPRQAALVAAVALTLAGLAFLPQSYNPGLANTRAADYERYLFGSWLNEHTPPDYTIAAFAIGALSYYADDRDFLDLFGLNDVTIAHTDVPDDLGSGLLGHEKYNIDYVLDRARPEIIVVNDADLRPLTEDELRKQLSVQSPVVGRNKLLADPRLWERYDARSLKIGGMWFNFLQRADTVPELRAPGLR